jgi:hypothetical protein
MAVLHCVITKEFTFRGKPERFGNGYTLQTTSPLDTAFVKSVCDALVAMERARTHSVVKFPYRVGGPIGQDAVYTEEVASPPAGLQTFTGSWHPEMCVLAKSRIGPKRYAFKYYHGWMPVTNPCGDQLAGGFQTAIEAELLKLTNGTLPGSATYCRPNGQLLTAPFLLDPYLRNHQLKRRGKRNA